MDTAHQATGFFMSGTQVFNEVIVKFFLLPIERAYRNLINAKLLLLVGSVIVTFDSVVKSYFRQNNFTVKIVKNREISFQSFIVFFCNDCLKSLHYSLLVYKKQIYVYELIWSSQNMKEFECFDKKGVFKYSFNLA